MKFPRRKVRQVRVGSRRYPYVGRIRADSYREAAADPCIRALIERATRKAEEEGRSQPSGR